MMDIGKELRRVRPSYLKAYTPDDDEPKVIQVPKIKRRWAETEKILQGLSWEKLEGYNADDGLVMSIDETDDQADEPQLEPMPVNTDHRDVQLVNIMLNAQDRILCRYVEALQPLTNGYQDLVGMLTERVASLERNYQDTLDAMRQAAEQLSGGNLPTADQMAGTLMQAYAMKMAGGVPPTPTPPSGGNGVNNDGTD